MSTFNVWVDGLAAEAGKWSDANQVVGGGTEFPLLNRMSLDKRWCRFIECNDAQGDGKENLHVETETAQHATATPDTGVVFKPLAGNAVYWENFRPDGTGRGWDETWHAGLPVKEGIKVGLNIWTWGRID